MSGGNGSDTASYINSNAAVSVYLEYNIALGGDAQGDTFSSVENLIGSDFDDALYGDSSANEIYGGLDADSLSGGDGNDTLFGEDGDDLFLAGAGADIINGGAGFDRADYYDSAVAVTVNLLTNINTGGSAQGDTLTSIEMVAGSFYDDILTGDNLHNTIWGFNGDDQIFGGDGNDTLYGMEGNNLLDGGEGDDLLIGSTYPSAPETLIGGNGSDTITYGYQNIAVTINLTTGIGGGMAAGDTYTGIENIVGSWGDDTLTGDANDNIIWGNDGYDTIDAAGGNDIVYGESGNDIITFTSGADFLSGGGGDDVFYVDGTTYMSGGVNAVTGTSGAWIDGEDTFHGNYSPSDYDQVAFNIGSGAILESDMLQALHGIDHIDFSAVGVNTNLLLSADDISNLTSRGLGASNFLDITVDGDDVFNYDAPVGGFVSPTIDINGDTIYEYYDSSNNLIASLGLHLVA